MTESDTRIESLEIQVRTLKRVLYTLCGFFVLAVLIAATNLDSIPDVIQAKKFEVVNDDGKKVAEIFADASGGRLSIFNTDGKRVALIGSDVYGGRLNIYNKDGNVVAELDVDPNGGFLSTRNGRGNKTGSLPLVLR